MRIFNNIRKKEYQIDTVFNKKQIINEVLEKRSEECPGWSFFKISKDDIVDDNKYDSVNCDFIAIYTDVINKEIILKGNPFSQYKRTVESICQIVREIYITQDDYVDCDQLYKSITASSYKELFIKLKREQE